MEEEGSPPQLLLPLLYQLFGIYFQRTHTCVEFHAFYFELSVPAFNNYIAFEGEKLAMASEVDKILHHLDNYSNGVVGSILIDIVDGTLIKSRYESMIKIFYLLF